MDSPTYFTLKLQGVLEEQEDLLTHFLFENGAAGVQEDLQFTQLERHYQPEVVLVEVKTLTVYFEEPPRLDLLESLQSQYGNVKISGEEHAIEDWLEKWKSQWEPFSLIEGTWVVPHWHRESFDPKGDHCIFIEPGMAFGTGTHATTQIASELLKKLKVEKDIKSFLDVGTGSGILSFLAGHLGIERIYAYDNDFESKRVFFENLENNPHAETQWVEAWSKELSHSVDLTLANIIDGVLLNLKPEFQKMQSPYFIFTGILKERELAFLEEMLQDFPLRVKERIEKDEWVGFLMERSS